MKPASKAIHSANNVERSGAVREWELKTRYEETMKLTSGVGLFLNFNAVLLISVFIVCYILFS